MTGLQGSTGGASRSVEGIGHGGHPPDIPRTSGCAWWGRAPPSTSGRRARPRRRRGPGTGGGQRGAPPSAAPRGGRESGYCGPAAGVEQQRPRWRPPPGRAPRPIRRRVLRQQAHRPPPLLAPAPAGGGGAAGETVPRSEGVRSRARRVGAPRPGRWQAPWPRGEDRQCSSKPQASGGAPAVLGPGGPGIAWSGGGAWRLTCRGRGGRRRSATRTPGGSTRRGRPSYQTARRADTTRGGTLPG